MVDAKVPLLQRAREISTSVLLDKSEGLGKVAEKIYKAVKDSVRT